MARAPSELRPRLRRDVHGQALICASDGALRMRMSSSVLWLTSWSTVSAATPEEAVRALGRLAFTSVLLELSPAFVGELSRALSWELGIASVRPYVIGVGRSQHADGDVPCGWLDARLGANYGPREFGALFAELSASADEPLPLELTAASLAGRL